MNMFTGRVVSDNPKIDDASPCHTPFPSPPRFHLRGVRHVVFYSLPLYPEFYSELVNCLEVGGGGVTVLYSCYDALQLTRVVGSVRAGRMLACQDSTHVMVTTGH